MKNASSPGKTNQSSIDSWRRTICTSESERVIRSTDTRASPIGTS